MFTEDFAKSAAARESTGGQLQWSVPWALSPDSPIWAVKDPVVDRLAEEYVDLQVAHEHQLVTALEKLVDTMAGLPEVATQRPPQVLGRLEQADGTPAARVQVALEVAGMSTADARASSAITTADGSFVLTVPLVARHSDTAVALVVTSGTGVLRVEDALPEIRPSGVLPTTRLDGAAGPLPTDLVAALQQVTDAAPTAGPVEPHSTPTIAVGEDECQLVFRKDSSSDRFPYGVLFRLTDPALSPSPEAPVGAPIAAQASFTTDTARDHSTAQRYSFVFEEPIVEQGYYTYKWDVDANDQDPAVAGEDCVEPNASSGCRVLPKNYFFSDGFGAAHETQVGKMEQTFSTKLSTHEVGLDESFTDTITLPDMQNWLRDDAGSRLPLTLTGIAYLASGTELAQSAEVPGDAQQLATVRVTTDPHLNGQQLVSEAIAIPVSTRRDLTHVTMRWCIVDEDQDPRARGFWEERCDDFGLPDESAKIVHPSVRTEAKPLASTDEPLTDTAVVNGRVPAHTSLVFELFKKPAVGDLKRDADGNTTSERWQQHEFDALADAPVCVDENRVARTEAVSVDPGLGEESRYVSPEVRVTENGTYWWVESLIHFDPDSGSETVLLSGICGLTNETTQVADPKTPPPAPEPTPLALAATGSESARDSLTWGAAGIAGLLVAAAAVVLLVRWRRWRAVHPEVTQVRDCEG